MRRADLIVLAVGGSLAASCTSDAPAPPAFGDTDSVGEGNDTDAGLAVHCSNIPRSAISATFDYTPVAEGGDGSYSWSQVGLPSGLALDPATGQIVGSPQETGEFEIELSVTDGTGATASRICVLEVSPRLEVELELEMVPACARDGQTLRDFLVAGTGTGEALVCDAPGGQGNGKLPDGIVVDPQTCEVSGAPPDDILGTWVFMVRGAQAGAAVWMPYCVTNSTIDGYDISVDHSGLGVMDIDGTLVPLTRTFDPDEPLRVGGESDAGPVFRIIDQTVCSGSSCYYGFAYGINSSPFDVDSFALVDDELIIEGGDRIGFTHQWAELTGDQVDDQFRGRPWVLSVDLEYCLAGNADDCTGVDNIRANGNGRLHFAVLMIPES